MRFLLIIFITISIQTSHANKLLIAYNVAVGNNYEIFVTDERGQHHNNISNHSATDWASNSCGNRIYFLSNRTLKKGGYQLFSMQANGDDVKRHFDPPLKDSWVSLTHDCQQILVTPKNQYRGQFLIIDPNGVVINSIYTPFKYNNDPEFSADGSSMYFRADPFDDKKDPNFQGAIYHFDFNSQQINQISHYPKQDHSAKWYQYKSGPPKAHPSGEFISYMSVRNGNYQIQRLNQTGQASIPLFTHPLQTGYHSWSVDGDWLAFETFTNESGPYEIHLMAWPDGPSFQLTNNQFQYQQAPIIINQQEHNP